MDVRLAWFAAMVHAVTAKSVEYMTSTADDDDTAALLLDPRLLWAKGARVNSFLAGIAASFLPGHVSILNQVAVVFAVP